MKTKIYIVSYVNFDDYDNNLHTELHIFTDRKAAEEFFKKECRTALADARCEEQSDDPEEWKIVEENDDYDNVYYVSRFSETYYTKVELKEQEIENPENE